MNENEMVHEDDSLSELQEEQNSEFEEKTEPADNEISEIKLPEPGAVRIGKRNFLGKIIVACGAIMGMELGYSGVRLLTTKPVGEKKPVNLSLTMLPLDGRITVIYDGEKVEVRRTEKGITAMSMVCTHLGCLVIWEEEKRQYHCPCHDAYFSEDGQVISGPPTQPLEKIPVTVSGNTVIIGGQK